MRAQAAHQSGRSRGSHAPRSPSHQSKTSPFALDTIRSLWDIRTLPTAPCWEEREPLKESRCLTYTPWTSSTDEQAALVMLGFRDDVEVRAAYEVAVENVESAREAYDAALSGAVVAA